jgi:hypothetical protein
MSADGSRPLDRVIADLLNEAIAGLQVDRRPAWVPEPDWARAKRVFESETPGWVGGHLGFLEDLTVQEAVRRQRPRSVPRSM